MTEEFSYQRCINAAVRTVAAGFFGLSVYFGCNSPNNKIIIPEQVQPIARISEEVPIHIKYQEPMQSQSIVQQMPIQSAQPIPSLPPIVPPVNPQKPIPINNSTTRAKPEESKLEMISMPVRNKTKSNSRRFEYFVLHTTGADNIQSSINWFNNPASSASAHWIIDTDGKVYKTVAEQDVAWAVRPIRGISYNSRALSLELVGFPNKTTPAEEYAAAKLATDRCNYYGITKNHIVGHMDLGDIRGKPDPGRETELRILSMIPDNVGQNPVYQQNKNHKYNPTIKSIKPTKSTTKRK